MNKLTISVDFDGCIVVIDYPHIGTQMTGVKETLKKWKEQGHTIIINTCRAGKHLAACRQWLETNKIPHHFVNENDPVTIVKYGMDTRKISADVYLDDKNLGGFPGWKKADEYVQWLSNRKPVVLCLVGESGSGKTYLANYIETKFGVRQIESHTTRPKRYPTEKGHTFITDSEFDLFKEEDMIAFTKFSEYRYCCLKSDVKEENTYVIDEYGLNHLQLNFSGIYDIKTIRVTCGLSERIERAGQERVDRDKGKFVVQQTLFDFVWRTDGWRDKSTRREKEYEELDDFINKSLNRGWS